MTTPSARLALLISLASLTGACESSPPSTDGGPAEERDAGPAERDGGAAERDTGAMCVELFEECTTRSDCCGELYCNGGFCQEVACADAPASCTTDDECCTALCVIGEDGASGTCAPPGCIRDGDPENRCTADAECCSGHCNMLFGSCQATACVLDGTTCTTNEECCSERCRIVSGTTGTCTSTCSSMNGPCEVTIDCCFTACNGGFCRCSEAGRLCRGDSECCSGTCTIAGGGTEGLCE